jgi:opacity protein-like surface antigen
MMKLIATVFALALAVSAQAADVTGKWKASAPSFDGSTMELVFTFKVDGTKLSGSVTSPMGETPISEGTVDGDAITFTVDMGDFKIVHKGTVSGDTMTLKVLMGDQGFDMTATRVPAEKK